MEIRLRVVVLELPYRRHLGPAGAKLYLLDRRRADGAHRLEWPSLADQGWPGALFFLVLAYGLTVRVWHLLVLGRHDADFAATNWVVENMTQCNGNTTESRPK
jgi:hypothetical protein